jgi:L-ascorbate metabolism protein UlaG (beta-lactamase superfamily)
MIEPALRDDALLADVRAPQPSPGHFRLWWLGQSGFLMQWRQRHLLIDPYLSDSLTHKYAATDKPHVRMTLRAIAPERLDFIYVATSSHNHTDHLDAETLGPLLRANPGMQLIFPEANREFVARRLGTDLGFGTGLDDGFSVEAAGFCFTGVSSAHETVERDERGRCRFLGYIVQFGPWTLYHSGDTVLYAGMAERLKQWRIDVALLPINGASPERRVPGNLNGREAAELAYAAQARLVIPCHYEMFEFNTASPDDFAAHARRIGQRYQILRCGERWDSSVL